MTTILETIGGKRKRRGQSLGVYLILKRGETVLLSLRKNTGYYDGYYGLVAGHVEDGESMSAAIIREAQEEANLVLCPQSLQIVHLMHRNGNRCHVDVFFALSDWEGEIINLERNKCGGLEFFSLSNLPDNLIPYIRRVLHAVHANKFYSEDGWGVSLMESD